MNRTPDDDGARLLALLVAICGEQIRRSHSKHNASGWSLTQDG